jgi:peptide methionine sulfoxide reductase MsrB
MGHVFEGVGLKTPTVKRYCINGVGLKFVPAKEAKDKETPSAEPTGAPEKK